MSHQVIDAETPFKTSRVSCEFIAARLKATRERGIYQHVHPVLPVNQCSYELSSRYDHAFGAVAKSSNVRNFA